MQTASDSIVYKSNTPVFPQKVFRYASSAVVKFLLAGMLCLAIEGKSWAEGKVVFRDMAYEAGLRVVTYCGGKEKNHLLESGGTGAAFFDYDGDGYLDIYIVSAQVVEGGKLSYKGKNALYRNKKDGRFEDETEKAKVGYTGWGSGVCAGDYDNDGDLDLYVTNFGANILYRNNGDGTFTDVAKKVGVGDDRWGSGATFFDYDKDGDLDLYLANYVDCTMEDVLNAQRSVVWRGTALVMKGPVGLKGAADVFYQNEGDGTFVEVTDKAGIGDRELFYGFGVCATDYDNDGDTDLYVANDSNQNFLYRNDGNRRFEDISLWSGAGFSEAGRAQAGMGVDSGDYDNDGDFDILVTNFALDYCTLYRNSEGLFEDVSQVAGISDPSYNPLSWGTSFFDYDNDGDLDIFIANGHVYPQVDDYPELNESYKQKNLLLKNDGGYFVDVSDISGPGLEVVESSRGTAFGDYDNDGDLDILVVNVDATPTLLRNDGGNRNSWIEVSLEGIESNRYGIGALLTVVAGDTRQIREIRSGSGYVSQNDLRAHFGLGTHSRVKLIEVRWPNGKVTRLENVSARRIIKVKEDGTLPGQ